MSEAIQPITMPQWGLAMTEGTVAAWQVAEGAAINAGDEIMEIETSKITNVYEAPTNGILRRRVVDDGQTVPVKALLGIVADADTSGSDIDAFIESYNKEFEEALAAAEEAGGAPEPVFTEVGGHRLCYLRMGPDEGMPLVLLHGFGGDLNNWMFNQPVLAEDLPVYAVDFPGHGQSEKEPVYAVDFPGHGQSEKEIGSAGIDALTLTVLSLLDTLEIDRAHMAGHSMGGAVALNLALSDAPRVASLTMVAPAGLGHEINGDYISGFVQAARRKEMKVLLQELFAEPSLVSRDMVNDILKYKRLDGVDIALSVIAEAVFPAGRQALVLRDRLEELTVPAQVIWGKQDRILPVGHAEALPDTVSVHLFEDTGHMAHMERASDVNGLIGALTRA